MSQNRIESTLRKLLFKELPYYGVIIISSHGQFNNLMESEFSSKFSLSNLPSSCDMNLFTLNTAQSNIINPNENLDFNLIRTSYYSPHSFSQVKRKIDKTNCTFSVIHNNLRSLQCNFEDFQTTY